MTGSVPESQPRPVTVHTLPIELGQLLKFAGLAGTGGEAKRAIATGRVLVNGVAETRKGRTLKAGDEVAYDGHILVISGG